MQFNEPLNRDLSSAKLFSESTRGNVQTRVLVSDRSIVISTSGRLARSAYRVNWRAISTLDGHPVEGSFGFGVRTAPLGSAQSLQSNPLKRNGLARIAARAALYGGLAVFAGGLIVAMLWVPRRRDPDAEPLAAPDSLTGRTALVAGVVAASGAALTLLVDMANAGGNLSASTFRAYITANIAGEARLVTLIAICAALAATRRKRTTIAVGALLVAMAAIAFSGHANSASPRPVALATDWMHLVAASVWVGGMVHIALYARRVIRSDKSPASSTLLPVIERFGDLAVPAFLATIITGLYNMAIELGRLPALWETSYGRVLAAKMFLIGLLGFVSFLHSRILRSRRNELEHASASPDSAYWRLLTNEPLVAIGIVALAATLAIFPIPPRQGGVEASPATAGECKPCPATTEVEASFAAQAGSTLVAAWLRPSGRGVQGTFRTLDRAGRPIDRAIQLPTGTITRKCGLGCAEFTARPIRGELGGRLVEDGESYEFRLPGIWLTGPQAEAKRLVRRAQRKMQSTRTLRASERISIDADTSADTNFRSQRPDRLDFSSSSGAAGRVIGRHRWNKSKRGAPWTGPTIDSSRFSTVESFAWNRSARAAWVLRRNHAAQTIDVAFTDPTEPVWYRLRIDARSGRVVDERMISPGHFMHTRYFAFNTAIAIKPPPTKG